jgi:hypothetical protein
MFRAENLRPSQIDERLLKFNRLAIDAKDRRRKISRDEDPPYADPRIEPKNAKKIAFILESLVNAISRTKVRSQNTLFP